MSRDIKQHITQEEFIGFYLEQLPEELAQEVDRHLEICITCAKELEDFYDAIEEFPAQRWEKERDVFISKLQGKIFPKDWLIKRFKETLQQFLEQKICYTMTLGLAFKDRTPLDIESEDGRYGIFIEEETNGNLNVYIDSKAIELEGVSIRFYAGVWAKDIRLAKVTDTQLGAKFIITHKERENMPKGTVLRAKLIDSSPPSKDKSST